jgi:nitrous oxidase accessory protein
MWKCLLSALILAAAPLAAAEVQVQPGAGTLATAIAGAAPGDVLVLSGGAYRGPVTIDRALTIRGRCRRSPGRATRTRISMPG